MDDSVEKTRQSGPDDDLVREVARMVAEWEDSDELTTEFARRVIQKVLEFHQLQR